MSMGETVVRQVLHGLCYPAEKWQILTQADLYGADSATRAALQGLPARVYGSPSDIALALTGNGVGERRTARR
jgi:hypothetical protein